MRQKRKEQMAKLVGQDHKLLKARRNFRQEQHFDDCGSDIGGIDEDAPTATVTDALMYCWVDDYHNDIDDNDDHDNVPSEDEERRSTDYLNNVFITYYGPGSDADETELHGICPQHADEVEPAHLPHFLALPAHEGKLDIIEICGGEAGVARLAIRGGFRTGANADIVCGIDFMKQDHVHVIIDYVDKHRPCVAIMAPPCTAMGGWSRYNRVVNYHSWKATFATGEQIAATCALMAKRQEQHGNHWLLENPLGSDFFHFSPWRPLLVALRSARAALDQCRYGLRDAHGHPHQEAHGAMVIIIHSALQVHDKQQVHR